MLSLLLSISTTFLGSLLLIYVTYYLVVNSARKKGSNWASRENREKVSLIIATYNEEDTLPKKLENVLELDFPKEDLELVIIDSGSKDRTPEMIEEFAKGNPHLRIEFILEKERLGKTHAVNVAYQRATGNIKIISDADAILEKSAIRRIVSNFSDPRIGAACGRQILLNPDQTHVTALEKSYRDFYQVLREGESILDSTPIFHGELSAYRAELIEPLPENKSADDSRLANIVRRKGYRAVYDPSAIFYEYAPPTLRSRLTQKVRRGQGLIRVFWDCRGCFFRAKYGRYGTLILPMAFMMHAVFPALWITLIAIFLTALTLHAPLLSALMIGSIAALIGISYAKTEIGLVARGRTISNLALSFLSSQLILFCALLLWVSRRSLHKWQKVEDIRREWKAKDPSGGVT